MDVLTQFPIRRSEAQKELFRRDITAFVQQAGYCVSIETAKKGVHNMVIGDPEKAKYLVTAHYDTPSTNLFPNFLLPANRFLFILYQVAIILAYFLVAAIPGGLAFALTQELRTAGIAADTDHMGRSLKAQFKFADKTRCNRI